MEKDSMMVDKFFLTDGGLETTLIFHHGIELNHFAAFELLNKPEHKSVIRGYYESYLNLAKKYGTGFILESATWRANPDWGETLGFSARELYNVNLLAITQLQMIKQHYMATVNPIYISGCIGPRSDGYKVGAKMDIDSAAEYHMAQIKAFKESGADMASALTLNYIDEGLGIAVAARTIGLPIVLSFTVETDGKLPSGETLQEAIETIDHVTDGYSLYYMINCAHPSHFAHNVKEDSKWKKRIKGIRANASNKSHAELDESTTLDAGDTNELASWYKTLLLRIPNLRIYGGCCGTDASHIETICKQIIQ